MSEQGNTQSSRSNKQMWAASTEYAQVDHIINRHQRPTSQRDLSSNNSDLAKPNKTIMHIPDVTNYPTGSLDFLSRLAAKGTNESRGSGQDESTSAAPRLRILVVGAGIGGLAAAIALTLKGHKVVLYEQAPELAEVGAGIQIPPNSARLLHRWGLESYLKPVASTPGHISFRRWESGAVIGLTKLKPDFEEHFGAPYYVVHRAHLHEALYHRAVDLGVEIQLNSRVESYDAITPSITLTGRAAPIVGDIIVAADGIKSVARNHILKDADRPPRATGFAAYRATVPTEEIKKDPDLAWLLTEPGLNIWIGHMRHVMTYSIAAGKSFNMVLSHPDDTDPATWNHKDAISEMRHHFAGWDRSLVKLIDLISHTLKWPLLSGSVLPTWLSPSRKLLILGDSAHAMLPYMSQGAAMAVEDAGALAEALELVADGRGLSEALELWESERLTRTSQMQTASLINGRLWHFADGVEQRARDEAMRPEVEGKHFITSPNQWSDPATQKWCYAYDAERAITMASARGPELNGH